MLQGCSCTVSRCFQASCWEASAAMGGWAMVLLEWASAVCCKPTPLQHQHLLLCTPQR